MNIEKDGKVYTVKENKASWTVSRTVDRLSVSYTVSKADCPTLDDLRAYVAANELF